jgi:hypothetical protein
MTLPRFLHRIADAAGPLLPGLERSAIGDRLEEVVVALRINEATAALDGHATGYLYATNLAARLYPHVILDAPAPLRDCAVELATGIHPGVEVADTTRDADVELLWCPAAADATHITVSCDGWLVGIDLDDAPGGPTAGAVAMVAAALAMSQVFRAVFAGELETLRTRAIPWTLHLVTLGPDGPPLPLPEPVDLGVVHLAGCGAIGEAAAAALATLPVGGTLVAVDHDTIDLGNLQRYVLTRDDDVGKDKPALIERALEHSSLEVVPVTTRWGEDDRSGAGAETVLTALDSEHDRIAVQASLPRAILNAWTSPGDIGISRHEHFGEEPCLGCLHWPREQRRSRSEVIAEGLRQHELRVLSYLAHDVPAGRPLAPDEVLGPTLRLKHPDDVDTWTERSLLDDVAKHAAIDPAELAGYRDLSIEFLYRGGVCGELLHREPGRDNDEAISVPLAQQSALAGALLALQLYISGSHAHAAHRPVHAQARYDVLADNPQLLVSPVAHRSACFCHDPDYRDVHAARWVAASA